MTDLTTALSSQSLTLMLWTAGILGVLHTLMGPDHYVPFVMMSRSERWPLRKTMWITFLCGLGHVGSSIVIGLILGSLGMAAAHWETSSWASWHEWRGNICAWLLMGFGAAMLLHGLVKAWRGESHDHHHRHAVEVVHSHHHDHGSDHSHVHVHECVPAVGEKKPGLTRFSPWVLFTIFIFGPCESLIPLMLAATAMSGLPGSLSVALVFSGTTVITIMGTVFLLTRGLQKLSLHFLERHAQSLAGLSLVLCGAAMQFLGL